jgi:hypothetical protein
MSKFIFVYGVKCEVQAESKQEALQKMVALQEEEDCLCSKKDCNCIFEGNIGIWDENAIGNGVEF